MESPWATALAVLIAAVACGFAGYEIAHSNDPEASAPVTSVANKSALREPIDVSSDEQEQRGYEEGFSQARKEAFRTAFERAYRAAYANVFEAAGLRPPKQISIPESAATSSRSEPATSASTANRGSNSELPPASD